MIGRRSTWPAARRDPAGWNRQHDEIAKAANRHIDDRGFSLTFKRTAKFFQDESKSSRFGSVDAAAPTGPVKTTELAGDVSNRIQPHLVRRVGQPRP